MRTTTQTLAAAVSTCAIRVPQATPGTPMPRPTTTVTFSAPLGDVLYFLRNLDNTSTITIGGVAVVGVFLGSLVSALVRRDMQFSWSMGVGEWVRTVLGAAMVGVGSVLAVGCTVGHGLTGVSTLALGSMLSLAAILLGAWATLRLERRVATRGEASDGCR